MALPHQMVLSPRHLLVPQLRASNAGSDRDRGPDPSAVGTQAPGERDTADQLRFLGSIIFDARAADLVVDDQALALAKWALGSVNTGKSMLCALSKTTTMYPDLSRPAALAQHIRLRAVAGRRSVTLQGLISGVRMCEKVGIVPPTAQPIHWAMAAWADRMYQHPSPSRVWATPTMFAHMSDQADRSRLTYNHQLTALCKYPSPCCPAFEGAFGCPPGRSGARSAATIGLTTLLTPHFVSLLFGEFHIHLFSTCCICGGLKPSSGCMIGQIPMLAL